MKVSINKIYDARRKTEILNQKSRKTVHCCTIILYDIKTRSHLLIAFRDLFWNILPSRSFFPHVMYCTVSAKRSTEIFKKCTIFASVVKDVLKKHSKKEVRNGCPRKTRYLVNYNLAT